MKMSPHHVLRHSGPEGKRAAVVVSRHATFYRATRAAKFRMLSRSAGGFSEERFSVKKASWSPPLQPNKHTP